MSEKDKEIQEENNNVNLFSKNVKRGSFEIENFSDEFFKNANKFRQRTCSSAFFVLESVYKL